eukprot:CAMPEP_0117674492 /NCGR_PEP_ID=MMETSP0804-20121206/15071_1 /TAXON_ID=1074897 /ORGANISM="Tetraselmis astigmatica, Strain CCMP880" /LENGTH=517 /DNA_ID=CAMNT_0005483373 /DNA_START=476 /DNA_END=2029 /DNA_ORIENTATION=+
MVQLADASDPGAVERDIGRLVARIAELEERLYAAELNAAHDTDESFPDEGGSSEGNDSAELFTPIIPLVSKVKNLWKRTLGSAASDMEIEAAQKEEFTATECEAIFQSKNTAALYLAEASGKLRAAEDEKHALNAKLQAIEERTKLQLDEAQKVVNDVRLQAEEQSKATLSALVAEVSGLKEKVASLEHWGSTLEQALAASKGATEAANAHASEMERRWLEERVKRRAIHEQLQVLRGNIRVMCRARPPQPLEEMTLTFPADGSVVVHPEGKRPQEFEFDAAFPPGSSQEQVFKEVEGLVRSCADGYNVCIFAYGQTGSGKTHTMEGPKSDPGISVRALQTLFEMLEEDAKQVGSQEALPPRGVMVSMLEIYNEAVRDLLRERDVTSPLEVSAMGAGQLPAGADRVPGLVWRAVSSMQEVMAALRAGSQNRSTCATKMNSSSSRSHALLSIRIDSPQGSGHPPSFMHLIDLAGSERVNKSGVSGDALKEAQAINKSLSALGDVISSLQRKAAHIPFS